MSLTPQIIDAMIEEGATAWQIAEAVKADIAQQAAAATERRAYGGWPGLRLAVFERDGYRCFYCGAEGDASSLHCDHRTPRARGGLDNLDNLTTACRHCNLSKGPREAPREAE